eukprot:g49771.t1
MSKAPSVSHDLLVVAACSALVGALSAWAVTATRPKEQEKKASAAELPPAPKVDCVTLANGVQMPAVAQGCAFGNWSGGAGYQGFLPEHSWGATEVALQAGMRHFDSARAYATERQVGNVLGKYFASGAIKREDVFLTSKISHPPVPHLGISSQRTFDPREVPSVAKRMTEDMESVLDELAVGYLDLVLLHWPGTFMKKEDPEFARKNRKEMWGQMEKFLKKGITRAIGVSNFTKEHLEQLKADGCTVMPMVNQIEVHPYCNDKVLLKYCSEQKIVVEAYAPFASGIHGLLNDPVLQDIAKKVKRGVGQVILRWNIQHNRVVLPKSTNLKRMRENLDIFDFTLDASDMQRIDNLQGNQPHKRSCPDPASIS